MISYTLLMAAGANLGEWQTKTSVLPVTAWVYSPDWTSANNALVKSTSYAYRTFGNLAGTYPDFTVDTSSLPAGKKVLDARIKIYVGAQYTNRMEYNYATIYMEGGGVPFRSYSIPIPAYQSNLDSPVIVALSDGGWNWGAPPYNVAPLGTTDLIKTFSRIQLGFINKTASNTTVRLYYAELEVDYKEWVPATPGGKGYEYWRITVQDGWGYYYASAYNIEFREVKGVPQQATGGTPFGDAPIPGGGLSNLFDGTTPTQSSYYLSDLPKKVGYKFSAPRTVVQVAIQARRTSSGTRSAGGAYKRFSVEKSEDGVTWETAIAEATPADVSDKTWIIVDVD